MLHVFSVKVFQCISVLVGKIDRLSLLLGNGGAASVQSRVARPLCGKGMANSQRQHWPVLIGILPYFVQEQKIPVLDSREVALFRQSSFQRERQHFQDVRVACRKGSPARKPSAVLPRVMPVAAVMSIRTTPRSP